MILYTIKNGVLLNRQENTQFPIINLGAMENPYVADGSGFCPFYCFLCMVSMLPFVEGHKAHW